MSRALLTRNEGIDIDFAIRRVLVTTARAADFPRMLSRAILVARERKAEIY